MKPIIAISIGDINGIGPEVTLKAITDSTVQKSAVPLLVGPKSVFTAVARSLGMNDLRFQDFSDKKSMKPDTTTIYIQDIPGYSERDIRPGKVTVQAGRCAGESIGKAASLCLNNVADGMVTAPISKEALHKASYPYDGHTEYLAALTHVGFPLMIFLAGELRIALATIHRPFREVASLVTTQHIIRVVQLFTKSLQSDFGISKPRIAVLGLNPHAGEHGDIGNEEENILLPTIALLRRKGINVAGPFPADTFFGNQNYTKSDGILAMYHDQGLIPVKMLHFHNAVNFTAGLPIVRTSPDHGTAFDIAGKNLANPGSMISAVHAAVEIISARHGK